MSKIEVIHGDCLEVMKGMEDNSLDLVLTDPPYGIGMSGQNKSLCRNPKHNRKNHEDLNRDNTIPSKQYFEEMTRISKNQIIWGGNYFLPHLNEGHKGRIFWDKAQHGLTMSDGELAYTSFDCPLRVFTLNRVALLQDGTQHPTQKPVPLFRRILENYSEPGMKVLDCFAGSGTTGVACKELGRDCILIEKEKKYIDIIHKRLAHTTTSLFH